MEIRTATPKWKCKVSMRREDICYVATEEMSSLAIEDMSCMATEDVSYVATEDRSSFGTEYISCSAIEDMQQQKRGFMFATQDK